MDKVTVYRVRVYDVTTDEFRLSRRMATAEGARLMRGEILLDTATEIDTSELEPGEQWTVRNFFFRSSGDFQTQVKS